MAVVRIEGKTPSIRLEVDGRDIAPHLLSAELSLDARKPMVLSAVILASHVSAELNGDVEFHAFAFGCRGQGATPVECIRDLLDALLLAAP